MFQQKKEHKLFYFKLMCVLCVCCQCVGRIYESGVNCGWAEDNWCYPRSDNLMISARLPVRACFLLLSFKSHWLAATRSVWLHSYFKWLSDMNMHVNFCPHALESTDWSWWMYVTLTYPAVCKREVCAGCECANFLRLLTGIECRGCVHICVFQCVSYY